MNPLFPNHKPEDADLSNIPGYTGHPGQERVQTKADLNSQHENSAQGQADKRKIGGQEDQRRAEQQKKHGQKSQQKRDDSELGSEEGEEGDNDQPKQKRSKDLMN